MKVSGTPLTGPLADKFPKIAAVVGVLGLVASLVYYTQDHHRFFYSYLTVFVFFLSIVLGGMFFVIIQHLSRAGWSVVVRRLSEHLMKNAGLMAILFIPVLFGLHDLYHWTHASEVLKDHLLQVKAPYLNIPFFLVRVVVFFGVWIWLARKFFNLSVTQDSSGDASLTLKLQKASTYGILLFALSLTFSMVDWVMSITPHWYSTMFGVYFFAGSAIAGVASISLLALILRRAGFLRDVIRHDHYHDLGKLLYGFIIFWTYVAFSQYFLIWYANIPEGTSWYGMHFLGSWNTVAQVLVLGHFVLPFVGFMSKHMRRNLKVQFVVVVWMLVMHFLDLYWVIMPNIDKSGFQLSWGDFACFLGIGGLFVSVLFARMRTVSLVPTQDPRLPESLHHHT